jgi:hypothetical protein
MTNPLSKHFRQPAVHLKLPSGGKYWDDNIISIPVTGELPVYPMTVKDELILKTPDALMNGSSVIDLVHSCIPSVKNAWQAPITDIDAMLIAIRIASYGIEMDLTINCPACKETSDFAIDLRNVLEKIKTPNFSSPIVYDDLKFTFRPQTYYEANKEDMSKFEQERIIKAVTDSELSDEEKQRIFDDSFKKLTNIVVQNMAINIESITTPTNEKVTDKSQIAEFLLNCSRDTYDKIKHRIKSLNEASALKPLHVKCQHCSHEFESGLVFDYSRFFG